MLSLSGAPERLILFIESFRVLGDRVESQGKMKRLWQHAFPLPGPAAWLHGSTGIFFFQPERLAPPRVILSDNFSQIPKHNRVPCRNPGSGPNRGPRDKAVG